MRMITKTLSSQTSGFVLLIVLAILAVLAILGVAFATLQSLDRDTAVSYLDSVRSRMVSASGVEDAIGRLTEINFINDISVQNSWIYWGKEPDGKSAPDYTVPLEEALCPSFVSTSPKTITVDGRKIGFSGRMEASTYARNAEVYSIKVADCSGWIYVNDGVQAGPNSPVTKNLKRILNVLGQLLEAGDVGDIIVDRRPSGGYACKEELVSRAGLDRKTYDRIKGYVTTAAWVDPNVANPVPLSAEALIHYPVGQYYYRGSPAIYRYGSSGTFRGYDNQWKPFSKPMQFSPPADPAGLDHAVYAMDELNPVHIELTGRAPVNVNAAPREVLIALLTGLGGFFLAERRKDVPLGSDPLNGAMVLGYEWLKQVHSYSPADKGASALGYLYQTAPIVGPGMATGIDGGIPAEDIADEIIACRNRSTTSPSGTNYAAVAWGGPFKTWRQFNQFCDALVGTLLVDTRKIFTDVLTNNTTTASASQQWQASQAVADVLKSNFNPNLHLNELNPDANLYTLVDKTDLICNSTEFCFAPTGYFEIESLGMVLKPTDGSGDTFTATNNRIMAKLKTVVVTRLYDMVRYTNQKQFSEGTAGKKISFVRTNNNLTVEVGPEVMQGTIASDAEYDGYLRLATVGGDGVDVQKGVYSGTPDGDPELNDAIHAHFSRDFKAHHHASARYWNNDLLREDLGNIQVEASSWNYPVPTDQKDQFNQANSWDFGTPGAYKKKELASNINDKSETEMGPYAPNDYPLTQGRYRLARNFKLSNGYGKTAGLPALDLIAPSDQRLDGAYIERGSSVGYWIDEGISWDSMQGAVSFWVKPNFLPDLTGKPRVLFSASRFHAADPNYIQPTPFGLFFLPAHDQPAGSASVTEYGTALYNRNYTLAGVSGVGASAAGRFRPASLGFGFGFTSRTGYNQDFGDYLTPKDAGGKELEYGMEGGANTPSLSHRFHKEGSYTVQIPQYRWVRKKVGRRYQWVQELSGYKDVVIPYDYLSMFKGHGWSHVIVRWTLLPRTQPYNTNEDLRNDWSYDIYVNGESFASTTPSQSKFFNTETQAPYRRPHFSVHSYEEKKDGTLGRHWSTGRWASPGTRTEKYYVGRRRVPYSWTETQWQWVVTGSRPETRTRTVTVWRDEVRTGTRQVFVGYKDEVRYRPVQTGTKQEERTGTRQIQIGTREETRTRQVQIGTKEETRTGQRWVQTGSREETRTRQVTVPEEYTYTWTEWVKVGDRTWTETITVYRTEKRTETRPEWKKVGERTKTEKIWARVGTKKIYYWSSDGEKIIETEVPAYDWVERTTTEDVYDWVNVPYEVEVQVPDGTKEVTRTEPIYEQKVHEEKRVRFVRKTETYTVTIPIYGWETYTYTVTVPIYKTEEYTATVPVYGSEQYTYTVTVPVYTDTPYTVRVRVYQDVEYTYTVRIPENKTETYTVTVPVYEYKPVTVNRTSYRWEDVWAERTVQIPPVWAVDAKPIKIVANTFRFGEMSSHMPGFNEFPRNWTADSTIDEFYLWNQEASSITDRFARQRVSRRTYRDVFTSRDVSAGGSVRKALSLWSRGRYLNPLSNEAVFTSAPIDPAREGTMESRTMPAGEGGGSSSVPSRSVRILGASWTWIGEGVDSATMKPLLWDYKNSRSPAPLYPTVNVSLATASAETDQMTRDAGQLALDKKGQPIVIEPGKTLQYKVHFQTNGRADSILLASPVLDDITLVFSTGRIEFITYYQE